jgi:hypothetical protein
MYWSTVDRSVWMISSSCQLCTVLVIESWCFENVKKQKFLSSLFFVFSLAYISPTLSHIYIERIFDRWIVEIKQSDTSDRLNKFITFHEIINNTIDCRWWSMPNHPRNANSFSICVSTTRSRNYMCENWTFFFLVIKLQLPI